LSRSIRHHDHRTFRSPSLSPMVAAVVVRGDEVAAWADVVVEQVDLGVGKVALEAVRVV